MTVEWVGPDLPPPVPRLVDTVAAQLREKPGEWAVIDRHEGTQVLPWYAPLLNDSRFEVERRRTRARRPDELLFGGSFAVYARYRADAVDRG